MIGYMQGQSNTVHGADSLAASFASENTAGNTIIVCVGAYNGGISPTVSDSAGNTYTQIQTDSKNGSVVCAWYAQNVVGGGNTVTVAGLSGADIDLIIAEYAGLTAMSASSIAVNSGIAPSVTAAAITPTQSTDVLLVYSYDQSNSGDTFTFTTSPAETFVQREATSNTAGGECSAFVEHIGILDAALTPSAAISAESSRALYLVAILFSTQVSPGELTLPGAWVISSTTQSIQSGFGLSPFTFAATGLPSGITLDASTGTLSGAASESGTYTFTVAATDANGKTASVTVTGSIVAPVDDTVCAAILPGYLGYIR